MKEENPDILRRALQKQSGGYGTTNTEKKAIAEFRRGKIGIDHFAQIQSTPMREVIPHGSEMESTGKKPTSMEDVSGLVAALRNPGSDLDARVAALEALLSGLSRRSIAVCDSGTAKTMTVVSSTPA